MNEKPKQKLSTEAYKGVRDFYPQEMAIQNYIFGKWRSVVERFGYEEYEASVLEPAELYRAKSGEEIINEQTYTFTDRGDREVTLRPEMTPTVARMVAARKRELGFPLRWFSIPNLFRYEQPQRGRLREHWQLNVDIFGVDNIHAEVEVIQVAYETMRAFGMKDSDFEISINNRKIMNYILHDVFGLDDAAAGKLSKLIDKKKKLTPEAFLEGVEMILGSKTSESNGDDGEGKEKVSKFLTLLNSRNFEEFTGHLPQTKEEHEGIREIKAVISALNALGIQNVRFDQTLMRGFDYYTGIVFELFDQNPKNRRSICGGGRYDDLLSLFGSEKVSAVGFGLGDVTTADVLETYGLLPKYKSSTHLYIAPLEHKYIGYANSLAQKIRDGGVTVAVDYSDKKVGDKIKTADKQKIPFVAVIGEDEEKSGEFKIKHLETGKEVVVNEKTIIAILRNSNTHTDKQANA